MKRIIVSVTNDLTTDQRVDKVCNSLLKMGYDVLLVGRELDTSISINRNYKTKRFKLFFNDSFLFYAEYNFRLFFFLLFSKKTVLLANDLDTLLANFLISKLQNKKLVYDSHELFTEVPELIHRKKVQDIWLKIERWIFPKLKNVYTVNKKIAEIYSSKYKVDVGVIKNYPTFKAIKKGAFPFQVNEKKVLMYQGAINIGRGLELLIDTVKLLDDYILVIAGNGDIIDELKAKVINENLTKKVFFLGRIEPENLHQLTCLADLGFSLEEDLGLNYRFALPNKIFDYIQAEIPIIVSDLPEMKKVILDYTIGAFLIDRSPENLASLIKKIIATDYSNQLKTAKKQLTWQSEEEKLATIFSGLQ